jgi:hypothetical protein
VGTVPVQRRRTPGGLAAIVTIAVITMALVLHPAGHAGAQVGGSLSISVPASANLSSSTPINSSSLSAVLGNVTVSDTRTGALSGWTASVASTDFVTGSGSVNEKIVRAQISYWSGTATATSGIGTFVPGEATAAQARALSSTVVAFSATGVTGGTSATWRPTIVVQIPTGVVIGTYTGTITHSVS